MKQIITLFLMALSINLVAQSAFQRTNSNVNDAQFAEFGATSAANAWMGSGIAYQFGDSDISNNMLITGRVLLELTQIGKVHLPIMSNVEFSFDQPIKEFTVGLYPWAMTGQNLVSHGGAEFQSDGLLETKRLKLFAGVEYFLMNSNGLPLTVSVTPVVFYESDFVWGIESTIVVPIANGLGLLAQLESQFDGAPILFSLGIVTNKLL